MINTEPEGLAHSHQIVHGPSVVAIGLRVGDAGDALARAEALRMTAFRQPVGAGRAGHSGDPRAGRLADLLHRRALGSGARLGDRVRADRRGGAAIGLTRIDHIAQSMSPEEMLSWRLYYLSLFDFETTPQVDVIDPAGIVESHGAAGSRAGLAHLPQRQRLGPDAELALPVGDIRRRRAAHRLRDRRHLRGGGGDPRRRARSAADPRELLRRPGGRGSRSTRRRSTGCAISASSTTRTKAGRYFQLYTAGVPERFFFEIVQRDGYAGFGAPNAPIRLAAQARLARLAGVAAGMTARLRAGGEMTGILGVTGTVFLLIGAGFLSVRLGLFDAGGIRVLGGYVVSLALPALIFRALTANPLAAILDVGYLGGYLAGSLAAFALGYLWSRRISGLDAGASTFQGMGMSCANSGFVGYPILVMTLPAVAGPALALNMIVENLVMIPLVLILAERARGAGPDGGPIAPSILRRLAANPIVLALIAGLAVSMSGVGLPAVIGRSVDLLAQSSAAVSLVVIGGSLVGVPLAGTGAAVVPVVAGKLILHPLLVGLCLSAPALLGRGAVGHDLRVAGVLMAAMPAMGIYPILAQRYGAGHAAARGDADDDGAVVLHRHGCAVVVVRVSGSGGSPRRRGARAAFYMAGTMTETRGNADARCDTARSVRTVRGAIVPPKLRLQRDGG